MRHLILFELSATEHEENILLEGINPQLMPDDSGQTVDV